MTYHHEQAVKAIQDQANRAKELAEKLNQYARQMEDTRDIKASERMSWAINEIENFIRNINFASLARTLSTCNE